MIDLNDYKSRIISGIDLAIDSFCKEFGGFSALGIYSCPWSGWVSVCFNKTKSIKEVEDNCPDFEYVEYEMIELQDWCDEYNSDEFKIKYMNQIVDIDLDETGDEGFNQIVFNYLKDLVLERYENEYKGKIIIQMLDSEFTEII